MAPNPVAWVSRCIIYIFILGGILWLYQTQGLFIICAPDTDLTENIQGDCLWTASHPPAKKKNKKKKNETNTLSF